MSDLENNYDSPQSPIVPDQNISAGNLTETMLRYLKETSPWLKFIGILGFIFSGIIALIGLLILIASGFLTNFISGWEAIPVWLVSIFYLAMGALIFFPSFFTFTFGLKISRYVYSNSSEDLETAFKNNKSLWKFYGIMAIISLAIIPLSIIGSIIIGITSVLSL